ncbi:MAG: ABC transporter ATP-binding protein [Anaerolineae bacterium]|nr:ABC transporter ATP-binding protein [Anaerolineae bacterium]
MNKQSNVQTLLDIKNLRVWYKTTRGNAQAVDGIDLTINRNEVFGLAGESGCGKSTLAKGILGMVRLPAYIESGEAIFYRSVSGSSSMGVDLLAIPSGEMRRLRWRHIAYIPQGAMNVLNPVMRVERQILDAIYEHSNMSKEEARRRMFECLDMVGLEPAVARMYPHELSGGMKQRVTIAAAVSLKPELIIADEPTTALDVNVQQVILQELKEIREQLGLTLIYVTHDMAVHAELADRIGIMYSGLMVEIASAVSIFKNPLHPYTQGLIASIPTIGGDRSRMTGIPGATPSPLDWPPGCRFHPRCPKAMEICRQQPPVMREVAPEQIVACHLYNDGMTSEEQ